MQINFANMPEKQREKAKKAEEKREKAKEKARKEEKKKEKEIAQFIEQKKKKIEAKIADDMVMVQEVYKETIKLLDARYQAECAQNKSATENANAMLAQLENEYDNLGMFNLIRKMELSNRMSNCRSLLANLAAYKERLDYDYNTQTANAAKKQQDGLASLQWQQRDELASLQQEARNRLRPKKLNRAERSKVHYLQDAKAYLEGLPTPYGSNCNDLIAFCAKELELLANKKNSLRMTETQLENENYKEMIIDYLSNGIPSTSSDMIQNINVFRDLMLSDERVRAICRELVDEGTLEKHMEKGKTLFSLL